jgi:hypothetical protein
VRHKTLELLGLKRSPDSITLFRSWHTYAALAVGLAVAVFLGKVL